MNFPLFFFILKIDYTGGPDRIRYKKPIFEVRKIRRARHYAGCLSILEPGKLWDVRDLVTHSLHAGDGRFKHFSVSHST